MRKTVTTTREALELSEQNFLSELTGSFATPCAENPTVAMVEAAYRHHGLDWRYINCDVKPENLTEAVRGARAMGWAGFNCSIPHKVAVIEHLDGLGESAAIIGAVNCHNSSAKIPTGKDFSSPCLSRSTPQENRLCYSVRAALHGRSA